jgi:hypothetical protein
VIQYPDGEPELDLLFLGYQATKSASLNLASDLFGLIIQLLKWNFKFQFRLANMSDILKVHTRETKEKQIDMIENRFQELTCMDNITEKNKILFRAKCALNWIDSSYFLKMDPGERAELFSDRDIFKRFVVQVGVLAGIRSLVEDHLKQQIQELGVGSIIDNILETQNIPGFPIIPHSLLIQQLGIEGNSIKAVKKQLSWFWQLKSNPVNGERSFTVIWQPKPFEPYIDWSKFENEDNFPF